MVLGARFVAGRGKRIGAGRSDVVEGQSEELFSGVFVERGRCAVDGDKAKRFKVVDKDGVRVVFEQPLVLIFGFLRFFHLR